MQFAEFAEMGSGTVHINPAHVVYFKQYGEGADTTVFLSVASPSGGPMSIRLNATAENVIRTLERAAAGSQPIRS